MDTSNGLREASARMQQWRLGRRDGLAGMPESSADARYQAGWRTGTAERQAPPEDFRNGGHWPASQLRRII